MQTKGAGRSILIQIVVLVFLFVASIAASKIGQSFLEQRKTYLGHLLENEQNRLELSQMLQNRLLRINVRLQDLATANSYKELNRLEGILVRLQTEISEILLIIEKGGTLEDKFPVTIGNREIISNVLTYTNYGRERINLQVLELRTQMAELTDVIADYKVLVHKKIEYVDQGDSAALPMMVRKTHHFYKGIEDFFGRIVENSNHLYFQGQQEAERIRKTHLNFVETYRLQEKMATILSTLLILFAGGLVFRSSRRILSERERFQQDLQILNDNLEATVAERTAALEEQILQRKQAQLKLTHSERYYRQIIENISDIITIVDQDGVIQYSSPSAKRTLGLIPETIIGRDIRNFVMAEDVRSIAIHDLCQMHGGFAPIEYRVMDVDGNAHVMESFVQEFKGGDDSNDGYIFCSRDISGRKAAEDEARKLKMVIEQTPSSVVITDTNGLIEYVNPAFEDVTGYTVEEAIGQNPRVLKSGKTPDIVFTQLWNMITSGRIWQGEFINKKKNGELYEENVLVIPIKSHSGEITNFVAVKENITELKRAREQAENANKAKSNFLSNMSHELRTPLNAINGFSQLMLKSKKHPLSDKQQGMVQQIATAGNHLLQLINEVLDLARIESGEFTLSLSAIEAKSVIQECLSLIQPLS